MMIEDNFTPKSDQYEVLMPDVINQQENSEILDSNQTIEAFGSDTR